MNSMNKYAPTFLRISMGAIIIWFGIAQLSNASDWLGFLPSWTLSLPVGQVTLIHLNGWLELFLGSMTVLGFYTRFVSLIAGLHLLDIALTVGYGALGVRDFGLALAVLSIFMSGASPLSLDYYFQER